MTEITLDFLARQNERILARVHRLRRVPSNLQRRTLVMIDVTQVTEADLAAAAAMDDLDAACAYVQEVIGQTEGDVAGVYFSSFDDARADWARSSIKQRRDWLAEYLETEGAS